VNLLSALLTWFGVDRSFFPSLHHSHELCRAERLVSLHHFHLLGDEPGPTQTRKKNNRKKPPRREPLNVLRDDALTITNYRTGPRRHPGFLPCSSSA